MKKTQFIPFLFVVMLSLCSAVTVFGQIQLSDLDNYSWKENKEALESLVVLQSEQSIPEDAAVVAFSTQIEDRLNFSQILYKHVYQKIIGNADIQTSILDGFNETVSVLSNSSLEVAVQQQALDILINALKQ
ncbi:MAG: hypothetical protein RIR11_3516 [Bacteroidota bacterium]|jgi:hypothetical protein